MYGLSYSSEKPSCCEELLAKGSFIVKFGSELLTNASGARCCIHIFSSSWRVSFLRLGHRLKEASGTNWSLLESLPPVSVFLNKG